MSDGRDGWFLHKQTDRPPGPSPSHLGKSAISLARGPLPRTLLWGFRAGGEPHCHPRLHPTTLLSSPYNCSAAHFTDGNTEAGSCPTRQGWVGPSGNLREGAHPTTHPRGALTVKAMADV